jgi:hypothetical protein
MWNVVMEGVNSQLDGEYPMVFDFTNRDLRTIKQMSGVRALEIEDALQAGDNDVLVAMTAIALHRAGKQFVDDVLWDAPAGSLRLVETVEEDARPPDQLKPGSSDGSNTLSGEPSNTNGDLSQETSNPNSSGHQSSDTGSTSDLPTLVTSPPNN